MPRMLCTTRMPSAALALEKAQVLGSAITDGAQAGTCPRGYRFVRGDKRSCTVQWDATMRQR